MAPTWFLPSYWLPRVTRTPKRPPHGLRAFARRRAGRYMLAQIGPSNVPYEFQPYLGGTKIGISAGVGAGGNTIVSVGISAPTTNGAATGRSLATTSLFASTRRAGNVLASAAINLATGWTLNASGAMFWRGNAAERGGFFFHARFGFNLLATGNRHLIGMTAGVTTTADPSTAINAAFIGKDAADTNWQVMFNAGSGTATKVDTGITPAADKLTEVEIFAPPNANSIKFTLKTYDNNGNVDASFEYQASTNLPVNTVFLLGFALSGSGTGTTGAAIDILQTYVETDF